jgi:methylglyoxal synthase
MSSPHFVLSHDYLHNLYSQNPTSTVLFYSGTIIAPTQTLLTRNIKMNTKIALIKRKKKIALIAHDNKKEDMMEWAKYNIGTLRQHDLYATGSTGRLLEKELGLEITVLESGPLGGDLQIGACIANGEIDFLIFFWDPLAQLPHDPDVKALLRVAAVWNIPIACNRASADFLISSPLMCQEYQRIVPDYDSYRQRFNQ